MPSDSIRVSARFPVSPERLYRAWLDGREHGLMTGGKAAVDAVIGGKFTAWDDYITGMLLQLDPGRRIVQTWRTTEFPDAAPDSRLEILFEAEGNGTRITLIHSDIPEGDGDKHEDAWIDYYFEPMQRYFKRVVEEETPATVAPALAAPKAAAKPKPAAKPVKKAAPKKAKAKAEAKAKPAKKKAAKKAKPKARPKKKAAAKRKPAKAKARKKVVRRPVRKAARRPAKKRAVRKVARRPARKAAKKRAGRKKK